MMSDFSKRTPTPTADNAATSQQAKYLTHQRRPGPRQKVHFRYMCLPMSERIAVIGAGIAGLGATMALAREGREVILIERDAPPPAHVETAFETWDRKGATQLRHSHVFLGK